MPQRDHIAIYLNLQHMFEKLFNFEHVGLLLFDSKRDQLYIINLQTINKKDYIISYSQLPAVTSSDDLHSQDVE